MDAGPFIEILTNLLTAGKLPGFRGHKLMLPRSGKQAEDKPSESSVPVKSAVLILLYPKHNTLHTVLTKRANGLKNHRGQISFPGGRMDQHDIHLLQTAYREAEEEIGIETGNTKLLGRLSDLYISHSNFIVSPYVSYNPSPLSFYGQPGEVEQIIEVPFKQFLDRKNVVMSDFETSSKSSLKAPCFLYGKHRVWGATAMIIAELATLIKEDVRLAKYSF